MNISEAIWALEDRAIDTYLSLVFEILSASNSVVSIRTAMSAASDMVSSMYGPIFRRFDPEEVGSRSRAMRIGEEYASRLNLKWENLNPDSISLLSQFYPSHGFVIDFGEAQKMIKNVRQVNESEANVVKKLGRVARFPQREPVIRFLEHNEIS